MLVYSPQTSDDHPCSWSTYRKNSDTTESIPNKMSPNDFVKWQYGDFKSGKESLEETRYLSKRGKESFDPSATPSINPTGAKHQASYSLHEADNVLFIPSRQYRTDIADRSVGRAEGILEIPRHEQRLP